MIGWRVFFSAFFIISILLGSFLDNRLTEVQARPESKTLESKLKQFVQERTNQQVSQISVYFLDLSNNFSIGVNEKYQYDIASLVKLPLMMAILKQAQSDPQILTKTIIFYEEKLDHLKQDLSPANKLQYGSVYSVWQLIERMIVFSDNQAYNLLLENTDEAIFKKVFADFGIDYPKKDAQMYLSAEKYASFLRVLFNGSYLNKKMSEKVLELLIRVDYENGLMAGLPANIKVAHKFGERSWDKISTKQLHDCGIIFYPQNPYLLCVMTRGHSFEAQSEVIKDLSQMIYNLIKI